MNNSQHNQVKNTKLDPLHKDLIYALRLSNQLLIERRNKLFDNTFPATTKNEKTRLIVAMLNARIQSNGRLIAQAEGK